MHVHLLVPDVFMPGTTLRLEALETLLGRGRRERGAAQTPEAWLSERYALQVTGLAAFGLLAEGADPGEAWWLNADPVHLRIGHEAPLLADASLFELAADEAAALVAALNAHFAGELEFLAPAAQRWYARPPATREAPQAQFTPLREARGQPITVHLPEGPHALRWHALMNEAQMVLHAHPVNAAREARGAMAVNSLWFSGGGRLEPIASRPFDLVLGGEAGTRGLALASGAAALPLPRTAASWLDTAAPCGQALVILDALSAPCAYGDREGWHSGLAGLEADWFAPLLAALRRSRIGMITLHLPAARGTLSAETVRLDLHRLWRRRKPLSAYSPYTEGAA